MRGIETRSTSALVVHRTAVLFPSGGVTRSYQSLITAVREIENEIVRSVSAAAPSRRFRSTSPSAATRFGSAPSLGFFPRPVSSHPKVQGAPRIRPPSWSCSAMARVKS